MELCEDKHDRIVFGIVFNQSIDCPLCEAMAKIVDLEYEVEYLEKRVKDLYTEVASLTPNSSRLEP